MANCPISDTLERFARGELSDSETRACEAHLLACGRCAKTLSELTVGQDLIQEIREMRRSREALAPHLSGLSALEENLTTLLFPQAEPDPD